MASTAHGLTADYRGLHHVACSRPCFFVFYVVYFDFINKISIDFWQICNPSVGVTLLILRDSYQLFYVCMIKRILTPDIIANVYYNFCTWIFLAYKKNLIWNLMNKGP